MANHLENDNKLENYKGVFFNNDQELKYFESGAHFPYEHICSYLESLIKTLSPERCGSQTNNETISNGRN